MTKNDVWFIVILSISCWFGGVATVEQSIEFSIENDKPLKRIFYGDEVKIVVDKKP